MRWNGASPTTAAPRSPRRSTRSGRSSGCAWSRRNEHAFHPCPRHDERPARRGPCRGSERTGRGDRRRRDGRRRPLPRTGARRAGPGALRAPLRRGGLFPRPRRRAVRSALPRRGDGRLRHREQRRPLSRAPSGLALRLLDLPGQLTMAVDLGEWLNLALRWLHLTAGIAWIGSSFYFVWLDNHLTKPIEGDASGELWSVHGGGFYHNQKY